MTDQSLPSLNYEAVIATRNRPEVLPLSIPLMLDQSPPPERVIVVDSSDDTTGVPTALDELSTDYRRKVELVQTEPGLPMQRNVGLKESNAEVVMFPDDDALWFPGAAAEVLKIYQRDTEQRIGCVGMTESRTPPPAASHVVEDDQRSVAERLIYRLSPIRARIEQWLCAPPFQVLGQKRTQERTADGWTPPAGASLASYIHGFRMTFRRAAIEPVGFDESLSGYALYEDMNVCFDVLRTHVLVNAAHAQTYHHRAPGSRAKARLTGAMLVLNMIYVTCRHTDPGHPARVALRRYLSMRARQYRFRARDDFGRQRLEGINRSLEWLDQFLELDPDAVAAVYQEAVEDVTAEEPKPVGA